MVKKFTKEQVVEALEKTGGTVYPAALNLNCDRTTLYNYIRKYPEIEEALKQIRESMLDLAEAKLFNNIKSGKEGSIFYLLNNQGKERGYNRPQDINLTGGISLLKDLSELEIENRINDIDKQLAQLNEIKGK